MLKSKHAAPLLQERWQRQIDLTQLREQQMAQQALQAQQRLELALEETEQGNAELQSFNHAMAGRELEMIHLKQEVNRLSRELG